MSGPEDRDGEMSPWVEIINTDNSPIGIENFYLTDDPDDLTKWRIPRKTVAGNGRSLVYLSGKGGMTLLGNEVHSDLNYYKELLCIDNYIYMEPLNYLHLLKICNYNM